MKKIFGRVLFVLPPILLQIAWTVFCLMVVNKWLGGYLVEILHVVCGILAILFVTSLVAKRDESSYKLLWVIVIVALPILGALLYLMLGNKKTGKKLKKKLEASSAELESEGLVSKNGIQEAEMHSKACI